MLVLDGGASSAGTVDVNGLSPDVGGLSGAAGAVPGVVLNNGFSGGTLSVGDNNASSTFSGTLADGFASLGLNKAGSGTFTLAGSNTYSGGTVVTRGILVLTNTAALGNVTNTTNLSIGTNGELQLPSGAVTNLGNITLAGSGVTGLGTINGGTLNVLGSSVTMTSTKGTANISPPTILTAGTTVFSCSNGNAYLEFSGPLTSGNITTSGSGNFVFGGGSVNVSSTIQECNSDASRTADIIVLPGTTVNCGTYTVGFFSSLTVNGTMNTNLVHIGNSATGNQFLDGHGVINTTRLDGANNGTAQFSNGVLNVSGPAIIGRTDTGAGRTFEQDSGTVNVTSTGDGFTVGVGATSGTTTIGYTMDGGTLNVPNEYVELCYSTGTATTSAFQVLGSANTAATANVYGVSLGYTVSNGTQNGNGLLKLGNAGSLLDIGAGGIVAGSSGSIQVQLGGGTLASSSPWSTTVSMILNGSTATKIDASGGTINLGGTISGTKGLQENGSGLLVIGGQNTYSGGTTLASGTMQLAGSLALGSGSLTVNNGLLDLNGNSVTVPSFNGTGGLVTDKSGLSTTTTLTVSQSKSTTYSGSIADGPSEHLALVFTGTGQLTLSGTNFYMGGTTVANGTLIATNSEALADGSSLTVGNASFFPAPVVPPVASAVPATAVPEPGTLALLALAAGSGVGIWRRRVTSAIANHR
jgi:autotransporter-associated beta strand protein